MGAIFDDSEYMTSPTGREHMLGKALIARGKKNLLARLFTRLVKEKWLSLVLFRPGTSAMMPLGSSPSAMLGLTLVRPGVFFLCPLARRVEGRGFIWRQFKRDVRVIFSWWDLIQSF
jgi:hypothetical protein